MSLGGTLGPVLCAFIWAFNGYIGCIKLLFEPGATANYTGLLGTPLHMLVHALNELELSADEVILLMVKHGADVNGVDKYGHTVLLYCALEEHEPVVSATLLAFKADPNIVDHLGAAPLHYAVAIPALKERNDAVAKRILDVIGTDVNTVDRSGWTALDMVGWRAGSWGYHNDDGGLLHNDSPLDTGPPFNTSSVVGIAYDPGAQKLWFSVEGVPVACKSWVERKPEEDEDGEGEEKEEEKEEEQTPIPVTGQLYPIVSFQQPGIEPVHVRVNFGPQHAGGRPFRYDVPTTIPS